MQVPSEDVRKLQLIQLRIAREFKALCDANGIAYIMLAGTALGARRHRGFIPWDDDMDFGILRDDYDRFIALARAELPRSIYVQEWQSDPHMAAPYAKLRLDGTRMVEHWSQDTGGHKGIFIDVLPLDSMPDGPIAYWFHVLRLMVWIRLVHHQTGYSMNAKRGPMGFADAAIRLLSRWVPKERAKRHLHRLVTRYRDRQTARVSAVGGAYGPHKETIRREWATDTVEREFEDSRFSCPSALDDYLTHMYGDFMTLPPVEERGKRHDIVELDFGSAPDHRQVARESA